MDKELAAIILAILDGAEPKTDCTHKLVPNRLLDQLSERLAELGA